MKHDTRRSWTLKKLANRFTHRFYSDFMGETMDALLTLAGAPGSNWLSIEYKLPTSIFDGSIRARRRCAKGPDSTVDCWARLWSGQRLWEAGFMTVLSFEVDAVIALSSQIGPVREQLTLKEYRARILKPLFRKVVSSRFVKEPAHWLQLITIKPCTRFEIDKTIRGAYPSEAVTRRRTRRSMFVSYRQAQERASEHAEEVRRLASQLGIDPVTGKKLGGKNG